MKYPLLILLSACLSVSVKGAYEPMTTAQLLAAGSLSMIKTVYGRDQKYNEAMDNIARLDTALEGLYREATRTKGDRIEKERLNKEITALKSQLYIQKSELYAIKERKLNEWKAKEQDTLKVPSEFSKANELHLQGLDGEGAFILAVERTNTNFHEGLEDGKRVKYSLSTTVGEDHGTAVVGVIRQIAPAARIIVKPVLRGNDAFLKFEKLKEISPYDPTDLDPTPKKLNIKIINGSLAAEKPANENTLEKIHDRILIIRGILSNVKLNNALFVQGIGNDPVPASSLHTYNGVDEDDFNKHFIFVVALTQEHKKRPSSTYPGTLEKFQNNTIATLGTNILTYLKDSYYAKESGTSFAAPIVSGVLAIIEGAFPQFTAQELKACIMMTANKEIIPDYSPEYYGVGALDAKAAFEYAQLLNAEKERDPYKTFTPEDFLRIQEQWREASASAAS